MSGKLGFEGRVVIVTGAGNGLGRSHALLFASRGARVVVNDLGGAADGSGGGSSAAEKVVAEIREAGGEAVASYDSVTDGERIVQTALETWGRIDVVVNNAGILRDKSFQKMTEDDWTAVFKVHVFGAFKVTRAAWDHFREQGYGRVVMTTSAAGIYGNFGQANYSAAKLGQLGFANTLAVEGGRKGIHVNTIAPLAASRLTKGIVPDAMFDALQPELVSPLVAWLCHEDCTENGGLFEVGGGFFAKDRWERAAGKVFRLGRSVTPEDIRGAWGEISGFEQSTHPANITASMGVVMDNINAGPSKGGNAFVDVDQALGYEYPPFETRYDERDVSMYALGVGAGADPLEDKGLQLVYEGHGAGFRVLPTFGVTPVIQAIVEQYKKGQVGPGLNFGLDRLLHGEQYTEVLRPMPPHARLTHRSKVTDIFDKGKGALIVTETKSYDEDGDLLVRNVFAAFIKGAGGWGGERGPSDPVNVPPERAPDAIREEKVGPNQALLYRLSGDINPLHVDPGFAGAFGFTRPILHGLCTYGYVARHVIDAFCGGDPRYFKSISVRFAKTVFPGETLVTRMWKESDTRIVFTCSVAERDEPVITHAAVELYTEIPEKVKKAAAAPVGEATAPTTADVFAAIGAYVGEHPELVSKVGKVFQFQLREPESVWTLDVKNGGGSVGQGETAAPECTLAMTDADFMDMSTGKADSMKLYMDGKLKISGDLMASQKLGFLKKVKPPEKRTGPAPAAPAQPTSADVMAAIGAYVSEHPELVAKVGKVFQFQLREPESVWTLDVKNGGGSVGQGETAAPECTLAMTDADFMDMSTGKADSMKLYMDGKLKISGDLMASQKLSFLTKVGPPKAGSAAPPKTAAPVVAQREAVAPSLFAGLATRLGAGEGTLAFVLKEPEGAWTIDLAAGTVSEGAGPADATLTLSDATLAALAGGADPRQLFMKGQLRVEGNMALAHDLSFLRA